ncbi:hypothetical protein ACFO0A_14065 [Novosphingobium tardum]|uniref:Uncharacterized protein n=2 Tax=Novosphingobium tardum TaxID=1538021 RepID=A0ABV8RRZ7_9SPHN
MASMKEIALGLTTILPLPATPDPLCVDLWNEAPSECARLVRLVIAECHDAQISLILVRVPLEVWAELSLDAESLVQSPETRIECDSGLRERLEFWRSEPS